MYSYSDHECISLYLYHLNKCNNDTTRFSDTVVLTILRGLRLKVLLSYYYAINLKAVEFVTLISGGLDPIMTC